MTSALDPQQVRKIARLARIRLSDDEQQMFAEQLSRIVAYVGKLNQLDLKDVPPLSHALPVANVFRDDEPHQSLSADEALANAPQRTDRCFKVPRVLDEGSSA